MTNHFPFGMAQAAELTKAGRLTEATALIQRLLSGGAPDSDRTPESTVIEGTFTAIADDLGSADQPQPAPARTRPTLVRPLQPRTTLRETLRNIAAGGMPKHAPFLKASSPVPSGAAFTTETHISGFGQRDYKLYIPSSRHTSPMALIVMLHGCTQSPDDFAVGTGMNALAEQHGFMVAYPAQPIGANANKCWNWFRPEDQAQGRGEPALIAGLTLDILRDHRVDPARIYVAGLSAGGAAAAIVAAAYPDLFSAVGVHSGLAVGAATDVAQAFSAMRTGANGAALAHSVPTIVIHGTADGTVHPRNGNAVISQSLRGFRGLHTTTRKTMSSGGKSSRQTCYTSTDGRSILEHWEIDGAGHAWAGGQPDGSFTDPTGPDASAEMLRFFLQHAQGS